MATRRPLASLQRASSTAPSSPLALCTSRPTIAPLTTTRPSSTRRPQRTVTSTNASTRNHSTTASNEPTPSNPSIYSPSRRHHLTKAQKAFLSSALRVNQAGELAATRIYTAQTPPINRAHPHLRPLMKHMYDQEAGHFSTFNALVARHRIRPTALSPLWTLLSSGLGWATGVMGREAAMACTEAVETEIGEHYNSQVRELKRWVEEVEAQGGEVSEELRGLVEVIRKIRDEELEHLDHAVENDAQEAKPYELLTGVIRAGCRGAIWVSEKV